MTDVRLAQASTTIAQAPTQQLDPVLIANKILADNTRGGRLDFSAIKRAVDAVGAQNRDLGARVLQAVEAQLSPTQRGELARATYPLNAGGGATFSITPGAPSLESQFREPAGSAGRENYNFFDRTFGDGNPATFDGPRIYEGVRQLQASGLTLDQFVQQQADFRRDISRAIDQLNPVNRLSDLVQPYIADIARSAGLGGSEWGARLQAVLDTPGGFAAFREGFNQGVLKGAEDFVVGIASLAGRAVQYGADNTPLLGSGGDALRGLTGELPGWLDAIVPSARRGEESNAALGQLGASFAGYVSSRAGNPAQIGEDIKGAIDKIWESVKADHAKAAAQGPAAEARWWGNLLGRVTFEVASTVVPVGKLGNVGKLADAATDLARTADRALDLSKLTRVAGDALSTARQAILDPAFGTAARGKLEDTLTALRRINEGALPAAERAALRESKDALEEAIEIARPRQSGIGNPGAIADGAAQLGARQNRLLSQLGSDGARIIIPKDGISIQDIAALTAKTGDEFAIFTNGNQRMVLRGNADRIEISPQLLEQLKNEGWRWSAHSQPGNRIGDAVASAADQRVLRELGQSQSLIVNSRGDVNIFTQTSDSARQIARPTALPPALGRVSGNTLVIDDHLGQAYRTATGVTGNVGDTQALGRAANGRTTVTKLDGETATLRQPATFDSRVVNTDGSVTYTKRGQSVTYDPNGFPVFNAKVDIFLDASNIMSGNGAAHFAEANRRVGAALRADPSLQQRLGLTNDQVAFFTGNPGGKSPPNLTWHHHQDTGRMQLVERGEHRLFSGGHTGGMSIWGGGHD